MPHIDNIKEYISSGRINEAIHLLNTQIAEDTTRTDELYYLRGNAYRKLSNWQMALNDYQKAIDINPASPAVQARSMLIDILEFYNKDMYNQ